MENITESDSKRTIKFYTKIKIDPTADTPYLDWYSIKKHERKATER